MEHINQMSAFKWTAALLECSTSPTCSVRQIKAFDISWRTLRRWHLRHEAQQTTGQRGRETRKTWTPETLQLWHLSLVLARQTIKNATTPKILSARREPCDDVWDGNTGLNSFYLNGNLSWDGELDNRYKSDLTALQCGFDQEDLHKLRDDGWSTNPCIASVPAPYDLDGDRVLYAITSEPGMTSRLSRSTSAIDYFNLKYLQAQQRQETEDPRVVLSDNTPTTTIPPPNSSSISRDNLFTGFPSFHKPPNEHGSSPSSPQADADAASPTAAHTHQTISSAATTPASPRLSNVVSVPTPRPASLLHSSTQSSYSSNSEYSIFFVPVLPRLYYKHSAAYYKYSPSTNNYKNSHFCAPRNLLTNPPHRLRARNKPVKESAKMNAELRGV